MNDHIAIVGAGLAGQLMALCLVRQGCRVSLIDRQSLGFLSKTPDKSGAPAESLTIVPPHFHPKASRS